MIDQDFVNQWARKSFRVDGSDADHPTGVKEIAKPEDVRNLAVAFLALQSSRDYNRAGRQVAEKLLLDAEVWLAAEEAAIEFGKPSSPARFDLDAAARRLRETFKANSGWRKIS